MIVAMPDDSLVHYHRISPVASYTDAVYRGDSRSYTTDQYDDIAATGVLYPDQKFELFSWSRQGAMFSDLRGRVGLPLGATR